MADIFFPLNYFFLFKQGYKFPWFGNHQLIVPPYSNKQVNQHNSLSISLWKHKKQGSRERNK